jgi:hypothetical protein
VAAESIGDIVAILIAGLEAGATALELLDWLDKSPPGKGTHESDCSLMLRSESLGWLVKLRWLLWFSAFATVGVTQDCRWVTAVLFGSALAVAVVVELLGLDPEPDEISPEEIVRQVRLKRLCRVAAAGVGVLACVAAIKNGLSDAIVPGIVAICLAIASLSPPMD